MKESHLIVGQSNAVGGSNYIAQTYLNLAQHKVQPWNATALQPIDTVNPASGAWVRTPDPIHSSSAGVGPGLAFADKYFTNRNDPNLEIGLVPCGWNSSAVNKEWISAYHFGTAFGMCIARAKAAQAEWGPVKGIIIVNGEQEASNQYVFCPDVFPNYDTGMYRLINDIRRELGDQSIKVVVVQLGDNPNLPTFPNWANVQQQQGTMAGVSPTLKVVSAAGLATLADGVHRTAAAQVTLGHLIADAMSAMT